MFSRLVTVVSAVLILGGCALQSPGAGSSVVSVQDLVGTWDGRIYWRSGPSSHGFTVKTVRQEEGRWLVDAERSKGNPQPMRVVVDKQTIYVDYEIPNPRGAMPVRLRLAASGKLVGYLEIPWEGGQRRDVRLDKVAAQ